MYNNCANFWERIYCDIRYCLPKFNIMIKPAFFIGKELIMQTFLFNLTLLVFTCSSFAVAQTEAISSSDTCQLKQVEADKSKKLLSEISNAQSSYENLSARFEQRTYLLGSDSEDNASGRVYIKRGGYMDWVYETPNKQRFISDSKNFWFYQPSLEQVTVSEFKKAFSSKVPLSFLLGLGTLENTFDLNQYCQGIDSVYLELIPKVDDGTLDRLFLRFEKKSMFPQMVRIVDLGGNENEILLNEVDTKTSISTQHFSFLVPKGVDIIEAKE